jgi:hypothetical protein
MLKDDPTTRDIPVIVGAAAIDPVALDVWTWTELTAIALSAGLSTSVWERDAGVIGSPPAASLAGRWHLLSAGGRPPALGNCNQAVTVRRCHRTRAAVQSCIGDR